MQFDVVIVGASFAGLAAARTAASRGLSVAVIEAKADPGARIHTTGILVREAIDEIDLPYRLTRRVPAVRLYAPNLRHVDLFSPGYAFYTTRTADLIRWMAAEAREAGAHIICGVRFDGAVRENGMMRLAGVDVSGRYLVGADGARSRVARAFGLSENRRFLTGLEVELEPDGRLDPRFLHCFADSRLAPGYIAWAAPGPETIQLGLAVRHGVKPDLAAFMARTEPAFGWSGMKIVGRRSGLIPAGGPLARTAADNVLLIGDAAGWVSPMTGGGIQLALRHGRRAGALIADRIANGGPEPAARLRAGIPGFGLKRLLRCGLDIAPPNWLIDLGLRTAMMRRAAEAVYFRRRGADGVDQAAYRRWFETEFPAPTSISGPQAADPGA